MLRELLGQRACPHVTMTEFEWFKHEARHGAFTCRLPSCPHATAGFESEQLLTSHEAEHRAHICTHPGCPYPPFDSLNRLKQHVKQQHTTPSAQGPRRQGIRRQVRGTSERIHAPSQSTASRMPVTPPLMRMTSSQPPSDSEAYGQSMQNHLVSSGLAEKPMNRPEPDLQSHGLDWSTMFEAGAYQTDVQSPRFLT